MASKTIVFGKLRPWPRLRRNRRTFSSVGKQIESSQRGKDLPLAPDLEIEVRRTLFFDLLAPVPRHIGKIDAQLEIKSGMACGDQIVIASAKWKPALCWCADMTTGTAPAEGSYVTRRHHPGIAFSSSTLISPLLFRVRFQPSNGLAVARFAANSRQSFFPEEGRCCIAGRQGIGMTGNAASVVIRGQVASEVLDDLLGSISEELVICLGVQVFGDPDRVLVPLHTLIEQRTDSAMTACRGARSGAG